MYNSFFITRLKRKLFPYLFVIKPLSKIAVLILVFILLFKAAGPVFTKIDQYKNLILSVVGQNNGTIKQENNHTNIVIMGIGGGTRDGANLTDTIILVNLNIKNKTANLVSIPRDLWIDDFQAKINTAYQIGENKKKGVGLILAKATVEQVTGLPVQYGLIIDFKAFETLVDLIGGIEVKIDNSFTDNAYPIEGKENDLCSKTEEEASKATDLNIAEILPCRFEKIVFTKGVMHMDGKTALKFVRSRHSIDNEGTDFARSERQIKLIEAIKNKIVKPEIFLNPSFITKIASDLKDDIYTDLTSGQMFSLAKKFSNINIATINRYTLNTGTEDKPGLLVNPPVSEYGAWVLIPRHGSFDEIHKQIKSFLGQ